MARVWVGGGGEKWKGDGRGVSRTDSVVLMEPEGSVNVHKMRAARWL